MTVIFTVTSPNHLEFGKINAHHSGADRLIPQVGDQTSVVDRARSGAGLPVILNYELYVGSLGGVIRRCHTKYRSLVRMLSRRPTKGEPPGLPPGGHGDAPEYKVCCHSHLLHDGLRHVSTEILEQPCRAGNGESADRNRNQAGVPTSVLARMALR